MTILKKIFYVFGKLFTQIFLDESILLDLKSDTAINMLHIPYDSNNSSILDESSPDDPLAL
jgi:hypothetical protein